MKFKLITIATASIITLGLITTITSCSSGNSNQNNSTNKTISQQADTAPPTYIESFSGVAIRGADPVAYFTEGKAVTGSGEFEYEWNEATWRFSSQENLDLFTANPEQYAPQYGGYCAKAVSEGNLASIDPESWKIVDGKLYLNYSPGVQRQWAEDIPGNIALGDENWPKVLSGNKIHENKI